MEHSEKIRIVFDGPPSHESGRFVEVENEHGEGVSFGEWKQDGEFWYLEFSNQEAKLAKQQEITYELAMAGASMVGKINKARTIMEKFVDKVDTGRARSKETYAEMKQWMEDE